MTFLIFIDSNLFSNFLEVIFIKLFNINSALDCNNWLKLDSGQTAKYRFENTNMWTALPVTFFSFRYASLGIHKLHYTATIATPFFCLRKKMVQPVLDYQIGRIGTSLRAPWQRIRIIPQDFNCLWTSTEFNPTLGTSINLGYCTRCLRPFVCVFFFLSFILYSPIWGGLYRWCILLEKIKDSTQ